MADDAPNPFQKLAENFAGRPGRKASPAPAGLRGATRASSGKQAGPLQDEDSEASAFFEAVSRIRPLPGKKGRKGRHERDLGASLAARMQEALCEGGSSRTRGADDHGPRKGEDADARKAARPERGETKPGRPGAALSGNCAGQEERFSEALGALDRRDSACAAEDEALFAKAMQGVAKIRGKGRDVAAPAGKAAVLPAVDPAKALRDVLEGRVEFALHNTDEYMEGFVVGVDPLVLARLRGNQYSPEAHVDLHGMNARQAYDALVFFFKNAYLRGLRTVVVITGRGKNSPDGVGVLRSLLQRWLCREPFKRVVLAFCTAKPGNGGPGAVYVLLRKYKKSRGKILWERAPSDDDFPDA